VQGAGDWSWSSLKVQKPDWLRDNKVRVLMQGALKKNPEFPDLPSALDFVTEPTARQALELYFTQKTVARPMITPPDVPADRLALLRNAFMALGQDKAFLEDAARSKVEIGLLSGEDVEKVVALIGGAKPEAVARFTSALGN
jgi:tripartite-type tricarboxylate transporter receptor subunit TctC